jgi:crotonobetainyl-CoA:carnitine CoA-transferase CaiB-like acyl-CoA transferase
VSAGVLDGLRVLEFSQLIAAPLCGLTLLDYGAEVIKVEPPAGEYTRTLEPLLPSGESAYFHMLNRGKRGVVLDLQAPGGTELAARLIDSADVVVESLGGAFGDPEAALARNPQLIWCSISGTGRDHGGRAIDPTLQAAMGMMALTGEPGRAPMRLPVPLIDFLTGVYAVQSILAARLAVERGGAGAILDCAMVDAAATLSSSVGVHALNTPEPLRRMGTENAWYVPAANFEASDGQWVQVMAISERHWRALAGVLGLELDHDAAARLEHRAEVHGAIASAIQRAPAQHWADAITAAGGFCQRIREIEEAWADPLLAARGLRATVGAGRAGGVGAACGAAAAGGTPFPVPVVSLARTAGRTGEMLPPGPALGQDNRALAAELALPTLHTQ